MVEDSAPELGPGDLSIEDRGALELISVVLEVSAVFSIVGNVAPELVFVRISIEEGVVEPVVAFELGSVVFSIIDPKLMNVVISIVEERAFEMVSVVKEYFVVKEASSVKEVSVNVVSWIETEEKKPLEMMVVSRLVV